MEMKEFALKTARKAIEGWVMEREMLILSEYPDFFKEKRGVFVTIHKGPDKELRGCIGYPEPTKPLIDGLIDAAIQATRDPRFKEVSKAEVDEITIEVSILTKPTLITVTSPEEYPQKIEIGKDGLIAESGINRGLLLPQVATEHELDAEDFLNHVCMKAGLPKESWREGSVKIYKFQAEIFSE